MRHRSDHLHDPVDLQGGAVEVREGLAAPPRLGDGLVEGLQRAGDGPFGFDADVGDGRGADGDVVDVLRRGVGYVGGAGAAVPGPRGRLVHPRALPGDVGDDPAERVDGAAEPAAERLDMREDLGVRVSMASRWSRKASSAS